MINLHNLYNHYLHTDKKHDLVDERVISYGWRDDGKDLIGHYVVTESWVLKYDMAGNYIGMDNREIVFGESKSA
tara:strand:- start:511 stop:732 length:222 start_codon:yes stop_codon:yes gene_type:complete